MLHPSINFFWIILDTFFLFHQFFFFNLIKPWIFYQCTDMPSTKAELSGLNELLTICLDAFYLIFKLSIKAPLFKIFFIIPGTFIKFSIAALLCFYKQEYWSCLMGTYSQMKVQFSLVTDEKWDNIICAV